MWNNVQCDLVVGWTKVDPEILKWEEGTLCQPPWLVDEENFRFQMVYKRFYKKREETVIKQSMRKEKLKKVGLCFI